MTRYAMAIKTKNCVGCNSCTVACKVGNGLGPGLFYSHVKISEAGTYPNAKMVVQPILCNNCENAACAEVCPVHATYVRPDGIVVIDQDKCIGCRYCMIACPYDVRQFITDPDKGYYDEGLTAFEKQAYGHHQKGTVEKCEFCVDRVEQGKLPYCVQICPAKARIFGDIEDPDSEISKVLRENEHHVLNEAAGTEPCVFYL